MSKKFPPVTDSSPDIWDNPELFGGTIHEEKQAKPTGKRPEGTQPRPTGTPPEEIRPKSVRARPKSTSVLLRIPANITEKLGRALQARPVKPNRHYWILEAIEEKASRELSQRR